MCNYIDYPHINWRQHFKNGKRGGVEEQHDSIQLYRAGNHLDGVHFISGIMELRILGVDGVAKWLNMFGQESIEFLDSKWRIQDVGFMELIVDVILVSFEIIILN